MMDSANVVRQQLLDLLRGGNSHMGYAEALAPFPHALINTLVPNTDYTPYRLLEHLRIAQWDIVEFVRNPNHVSPPWPAGHWPPPGHVATPADWEQSLAAFWQDLHAFQALVADPATDLFADLPHAPGYNVLREVLVLADHNAYHLGELALLRHVIGAQPEAA
jgi:hypothetical protein